MGMMYWGRLFRSRPWFDLVPDQKHEVVTGGLGEFLGIDYLAAGRTPDGKTVIAYMPTRRTINVDMSKVSGAPGGRLVVRSPHGQSHCGRRHFRPTGRRDFAPPTEGDWVLVLDDASLQRLPPGQI